MVHLNGKLRKVGVAAFCFFLIKGLIWLGSIAYFSYFLSKEVKAETSAQEISYQKRVLPIEMYVRKGAAPNIIIKGFVSINCGLCGSFYLHVLPKLVEKYVNSGRVKIILHHFPLDIVSVLIEILLAQVNDMEISKYKKLLYSNLDDWLPGLYTDDQKEQSKAIGQMVEMLKINPKIAQAAIDDGEYQEMVMKKGHEILQDHPKLDGTPFFVIAGKNYNFMTFEEFEKIIDAELAKL